MSNNVILVRYGELYLKGKNRAYFENKLKSNINSQLKGLSYEIYFGRGRYVISDYSMVDEGLICERLQKVFGIHSISIAHEIPDDIEKMGASCASFVPDSGTFRVTAHRSKKNFPFNSMQINCKVGEDLLALKPNLKVDLHNPSFTVNIDVRENGKVYVFTDSLACAGGMPTGTAGRGLLLLSGGIDSPVAGYMMAKRGLDVYALHFHSYPYTAESAKDKAVKLATRLKQYTGHIKFMAVSVTEIQEAIHEKAKPNYMITLLRRFMMRISERVAAKYGCGCLINGESLGQVASQTLESITVTGSAVTMPVFRPCIGMDKEEIISIAEKIQTYETSIEPYEDCCTVFLPEFPVIKPTMDNVLREEGKLGDIEQLIDRAIETLEVIEID